MSALEVNAAEGAIYSLSAAGLALLVVAAFFVWRVLQSPPAHGDGDVEPHSHIAE